MMNEEIEIPIFLKCRDCSNEASTDRTYCEKCLLKKAARRATGSSKNYMIIEKMLERNSKCPYTGIELTYATANLDHKIPKSRGGDVNIENVEWISEVINQAKMNLTKSEFITLCNLVAKNYPMEKTEEEMIEELIKIPRMNNRKGGKK